MRDHLLLLPLALEIRTYDFRHRRGDGGPAKYRRAEVADLGHAKEELGWGERQWPGRFRRPGSRNDLTSLLINDAARDATTTTATTGYSFGDKSREAYEEEHVCVCACAVYT